MQNDDIFFSALKKCSEKGLYNSVDMTSEFRDLLRDNYVTTGISNNWYELPDIVFKDFADLGYIHYVPEYNHPLDDTPIPENWVDLISISVMIKPAGLLFYNQWSQMKAQERANKLSTKNIFATLLIATAGLLVSAATFIKSLIDSSDKRELSQLSEQISLRDRRLLELQSKLNSIDYQQHKESAKKPSK